MRGTVRGESSGATAPLAAGRVCVCVGVRQSMQRFHKSSVTFTRYCLLQVQLSSRARAHTNVSMLLCLIIVGLMGVLFVLML